MKTPIYMDHQATTPVDPRVLERMLPYFSQDFGNAASRSHAYGWRAEEAVHVARKEVAALIGAQETEVIFTSGATEANNLALLGVARSYAARGKHIISQPTEHPSVLDPLRHLASEGFEVEMLRVGAHGLVDPDDLTRALRDDTILVSVMAANNEIGTLQPLEALGQVCANRRVLLHVDATQAAGLPCLDVVRAGTHLASLSAHKLYGPKGVGALYVRRREPRVQLSPILHGGGHERGLRSGTLNVPGIVGFGAAASLAAECRSSEEPRLSALRDELWQLLHDEVGAILNGHPTHRLPGNLHVSFAGVDIEHVLLALPDIALSSGAACTSASLKPSHVLSAIGVSAQLARGSLRFGLGRFTTALEVRYAARRVIEEVQRCVSSGRRRAR